jgi:hypothetical protein
MARLVAAPRRRLLGRRETSHRIGHEHPRTDQPHSGTTNQRRDHGRPHSFAWALRQPLRRDAVEHADKHEVRALGPALTADRERTHRVTPPVIPGAPRADHGERTGEHRTRGDAARGLRPYLQSPPPRHSAPSKVLASQASAIIIVTPPVAKFATSPTSNRRRQGSSGRAEHASMRGADRTRLGQSAGRTRQ